jgi:cytochrome oxidase Cu insertion factor (SCO1/SenC/PrrC family)
VARTILVVASLLLLPGGATRAALLPAERAHSLPRALAVSDEHGRRLDLDAAAAGAPTLLLPVFTRCSGTCPLTAVFLRQALEKARAPFRVIVFSFDAEDGADDLAAFRERFRLPADWMVLRSDDAGATRAFLDGLDFHFMKAAGGFDHPNQTFVFSPRGGWAGTLTGAAFPAAELEVAFHRALGADDPALPRRLGAWLIRPEAWIVLACAGLAFSLAVLLFAQRRSRNRSADATPAGTLK